MKNSWEQSMLFSFGWEKEWENVFDAPLGSYTFLNNGVFPFYVQM